MLRRIYLVLTLIAALGIGVTFAQEASGQMEKQKEKERLDNKEKQKDKGERATTSSLYQTFPMEVGERSYLGVFLEEVTAERAKALSLAEERGAIVMKIIEGSPAEKAGLKKDDVIVSYNGRRIDSVRELQRLLGETPAGRTVSLEVVRGGGQQTLSATLTKRTPQFGPAFDEKAFKLDQGAMRRAEEALKEQQGLWKVAPPEFGNFNFFDYRGNSSFRGTRIGVTVETVAGQLAEFFGLKDGKGVLVTEVYENRPAAKAGLKAGDVIIAIDDKKIEGMDMLVTAITEKEEGPITLTVLRNRAEQKITVTLEKRERRAVPRRRSKVVTQPASVI